MPNQLAEESRRVSYIEDKAIYDLLTELARENQTSVGELIRDAVAEKYVRRRPGNSGIALKPAETSHPARSSIRHFTPAAA